MRNVCDALLGALLIPVLRYRCPDCGHTVSFLPSFCVPRKQFSARVISICFQLVFACGVSLRHVGIAYPAVSRVLVGVWVKQWSLSSPGVISVLRSCFGFEAQRADVCSGHHSSYITPASLESFFVGSDAVLGDELTLCDGECDMRNQGGCGDRGCRGIIKLLQEKFASLEFEVRLF